MRVEDLLADLEFIASTTNTGTRDRPRKIARLALMLEHLHAWQSETMPARDSTRGGSSSPVEAEERAEDRKVGSNAVRDADQVAALLNTLGVTASKLRFFVTRYTVPVDHDLLDTEGLPGCVSCARPRRKGKQLLPGYFSPVSTRWKGRQMCNWCGEHTVDGEWPDVDLVDVMHRVSASAATRELAKRIARKPKPSDAPDATPPEPCSEFAV